MAVQTGKRARNRGWFEAKPIALNDDDDSLSESEQAEQIKKFKQREKEAKRKLFDRKQKTMFKELTKVINEGIGNGLVILREARTGKYFIGGSKEYMDRVEQGKSPLDSISCNTAKRCLSAIVSNKPVPLGLAAVDVVPSSPSKVPRVMKETFPALRLAQQRRLGNASSLADTSPHKAARTEAFIRKK